MAKEEKEKKHKSTFGAKTRTPLVRTSFAYITQPDTSDRKESDDKYKFTALLPEDQKELLKPIKMECLKIAREAFGPDIKYSDLKTPFKDGNEVAEEKEKLANYAGHIIFNVASKNKPGVIVGKAKTKYNDLSDEEKEELALNVGGYWVIATITPATYSNVIDVEKEDAKGNVKTYKKNIKGITFYLNSLWFVKDDERFGGGGNAEADFQDVELDDEAFGSGNELDEGDEDELDEKPKGKAKGKAKKEEVEEEEGFDEDDADLV